MRLFGYYALHSFVNQLKKLCKTWVLVFFLVCMVIGGLIGFGAAMLEDTVEENAAASAQTQEVPVSGEEEASLPISASGLIELIAGGAILALFFFEAVSADKNGSKIFLPADVNLLFPSPMKPQSVLMFRLATQLGTALVASIYIAFQLPNLMINAGLTGWAAMGILVTWFSSIFVGKLLQVLLYTVCSFKPRFKPLLRKGIYAFAIVLLGSFFLFWKAGGEEILPAADRFFNAPLTRWIPFWGWLKGLTVFLAEENWPCAALCFGLLSAGCAALVWFIWHMDADFYEDAMAKSEETAALMEKARSEKTSGTAVTRQRKTDRSERLQRDGMRYGWGASVFFHKTMYNRFRFAHLGFLTKTMETYFVAALGTAAVMRWFFHNPDPLPVALVLGALVFFRAMGNPLAEDTGMDFFRLIPESTWQKLFYSLLGGTVGCLMDLILPMLAASILLMVNPVKLLIWLPLIVSVDFYASSVVTFIDLSVPASIGKTIKTLITILFIYFGLLPDVAILAFGIALGRTAPAALGATLLNLLLGILAFSLASVFLQPKGRDYVPAAADQDLKAAKRQFSRIGLSILTILVLASIIQIAMLGTALNHFPDLLMGSWGIWIVTFVPQYAIAMPVGMLMLKKVPAHRPESRKLGLSRGVKFGFICIFMMYAGNLLGTLVTTVAGLLFSTEVINPLMDYITGDNLTAQLLIVVILAPMLEELIFRRILIDRMGTYGGKTAVLLSALLFGLYHGNFSQFFYAFGLGLAFGYIYLNTGRLRYSVIAHMVINFMGSILAPELLKRLPTEPAEGVLSPWTLAYGGYVLLLIAGSLTGLVLLCMNAGNLRFPAGDLELPRGKRFRVSCLNAGMLLMILICAVLMISTLAGV